MNPWFSLGAAAAIALVASGATWRHLDLKHKVEINELKDTHRLAIGTARTEEQDKCRKGQKLTRKVGNDYEKDLRAINEQLSSQLRSLRADPARACVNVRRTGAAGVDHAEAGGNGVPDQAYVPVTELVELAADADRNTAQLIACQAFIEAQQHFTVEIVGGGDAP